MTTHAVSATDKTIRREVASPHPEPDKAAGTTLSTLLAKVRGPRPLATFSAETA